jgi:hypothetical protein
VLAKKISDEYPETSWRKRVFFPITYSPDAAFLDREDVAAARGKS